MTDVMEHSGVFRTVPRGFFDYRSTDLHHDLPDNGKPPIRVMHSKWRQDDGTFIVLKVEYFYFPFDTYQDYRRYTLVVDGRIVAIDRVENHYAFNGTVGSDRIIMHTKNGELVTSRVRILDDEGLGTHQFTDSASWCGHEVTSVA